MTTQSLSDLLAAAFPTPEGDEARAAFRIDDAHQAEWAMRKLARAVAENDEATRFYKAEMDRLNAWRMQEHSRIGRDEMFFESLLIDWHRRLCDAELAEAGSWARVRHKTRRLPSGEVSARLAPDSWAATDAEAFLTWAASGGRRELIHISTEPNIAEAKRTLDVRFLAAPAVADGERAPVVVDPATGEVVPGITVTPGEIRYSVKAEP